LEEITVIAKSTMRRTKEGIKAASATYRKATNEVAKHLKVDPEHTKIPSDDFQEITEMIPEKIKEKALKWYKMGIKRGFVKATDMMLDGKIHQKGKTLYGPNKFDIRVRTKFAGGNWVKRRFTIKAKDIGFV
jgi:hypothetical protein